MNQIKWPENLRAAITIEDQAAIYEYLDRNETLAARLETGRAFRIAKEVSKLARTQQIIRGPSNEYMLMLDCKKKLASKLKADPIVFIDIASSISSARRIDIPEANEWINKTMKNGAIADAEYECNVSQILFMSMKRGVSVSYVGEQYSARGVTKRAHYSIRLMGDLNSLEKKNSCGLMLEVVDKIIEKLIDIISDMHESGFIHQDLKLSNIYMQSECNPELGDFCLSSDIKDPNLKKQVYASFYYASPEILMVAKNPMSTIHHYFYSSDASKFPSYSYQIVKKHNLNLNKSQRDYRHPHFANDMWALGIIIFELRYKKRPSLDSVSDVQLIDQDPLLKGLLTVEREKRLTIQQAKELYAGIRSKSINLS